MEMGRYLSGFTTEPLINNAFPESLWARDGDGRARILIWIIHKPIGSHAMGRFIHMIPAAHVIGTLIVETNVHKLVVPRHFEWIVGHSPFFHLAAAIGALKRPLDPSLVYYQFSFIHEFLLNYMKRGTIPATLGPFPICRHKLRELDRRAY
jgi:hypothetical protein